MGRRPAIDDGRALGITTRGNSFAAFAQHFIQRADGQDGVNTPLTSRPPLDMLEPQGGKRYLSSGLGAGARQAPSPSCMECAPHGLTARAGTIRA